MVKFLCIILSLFAVVACTKGGGAANALNQLPGATEPDGGTSPSIPVTNTPVASTPAATTPATPTAVTLAQSAPQSVTDPQVAVQKIKTIQATLISDPQYSISADDVSLMQSLGIISTSDEMKGWTQ